jgi:uncharacterized protein (TIGR02466 family)
MKPTVQLQFPYPIVSLPEAIPAESLPEFVSLCYAEKEADAAGVQVSNKSGGWQSCQEAINKPEMEPLLTAMVGGIKACTGALPLTKYEFRIAAAWINISRPGAFNCTHVHPDSTFSGVLYLQSAGVGSGRIVFDPDVWRGREMMSYTEEARNAYLLWPTYSYPPTPGMMLLFPSTLAHFVEANLSDSDRISVSFNLTLA